MKTSIPKIVIIEDNPADVRLLRYVLRETGEPHELEVVSDGAEAIRFVKERAAIYNPCAFVLDLHLPRYDGVAILTTIRSMPELAHVHVIALTTAASPQEERAIRALGVSLYREKPYKLDEMRALAEEILRLCHEETLESAA